ncbi:MAG: hypothetical protein ABIT01_13515 [Thermoanaerobaculia bacterium]
MNTSTTNAEWNGNPWFAPTASRTEPPHRYLVAALLSLGVLVLSVLSSGCTIGQTRFALGATLVADGATTQSALSRSGAAEGNAVVQAAPIPIMLVLSGVVSLVAENQIKHGNERQGKSLYRIASVVHGLAAAWNGYQLTKTPGSVSPGLATGAGPAPLTAGISGIRPFGPSIRSRY